MGVSDTLRPGGGAMKPAILALVLGASLAPTAVLARGCSETSSSRAVGHRRCGRFGDGWNTQSFFARFFDVELDTGLAFHSLGLAGREVTLCHQAGRSCAEVSTDRFAAGTSPASLAVAHFSYTILRFGPLRLGGGGDVGGGSWNARLASTPGTTVGAPISSYVYGSLGATFGVRRWVMSATVRVGVSMLSAALDGSSVADSVAASWLSVRATGSVMYFVHPYVGVGVFGGADVLDGSEFHAGAVLRFTPFQAYSGTRN